MILAFFSGPAFPTLKAIDKTFPQWLQIIMSFTMLLGAISLLKINLQKISRKADGWGYSLVLVLGFLSMTILGFISGTWPMFEKPVQVGESYYLFSDNNVTSKHVTIEKVIEKKGTTPDEDTTTIMVVDDLGNKQKAAYSKLRGGVMAWLFCAQQVLFQGVFKAAQATMFSLLAFFVASASFRAFRVKSKEAGLLMGSAFIVMLGNVPVGNMISEWFNMIPVVGKFVNIAALKAWIISYPSSAAQTAILIGAMLGYISASMKIILGVERSHLGGEG
jgi:hypothetical protein